MNLYVVGSRHLDFKVHFNFLYSSSGNFYPSILTENLPFLWKVHRRSSIDIISRRGMSGCPHPLKISVNLQGKMQRK